MPKFTSYHGSIQRLFFEPWCCWKFYSYPVSARYPPVYARKSRNVTLSLTMNVSQPGSRSDHVWLPPFCAFGNRTSEGTIAAPRAYFCLYCTLILSKVVAYVTLIILCQNDYHSRPETQKEQAAGKRLLQDENQMLNLRQQSAVIGCYLLGS